MSDEIVKRLLLPDGGPHSLSIAYAARSGGGKTHHYTFITETAMGMEEFDNTRFIYASVKQETYFGIEPVDTVEKALDGIVEGQTTVFYPADPERYEEDIDDLIDGVFRLKEENDEAQFVIAIDDCNVLDGFNNRGTLSKQVKKLIIAGRSKNVKGCFLCHRIGDLPRIANGNFSALVVMNISPMDTDYGKKVFGVEFDPHLSELTDYRWLHVDLISESVNRYEAVPLKMPTKGREK